MGTYARPLVAMTSNETLAGRCFFPMDSMVIYNSTWSILIQRIKVIFPGVNLT